MKKWIAQKDEVCPSCGYNIPRGSYVYLTEDNEIICQECLEELKEQA